MRILALAALTILALAAFGLFPVNQACSQSSVGCLDVSQWVIMLALFGLCGFVLGFISALLGGLSAVKRRQWVWLAGLVVGILAAVPGILILTDLLNVLDGVSTRQALFPFSVGLVLAP